MADSAPTPHDALFRTVFSQPEHAAGELRHVLPPDLVAAIDWSTLRVCPGTWVDDDLRSSHADVLCAVQLAGHDVLVYVLLEHKSWADPWTPFQLLVYMVRIWQEFRRDHPDARGLPPILPVVVHHSEDGWRSSGRLLHLVEVPDAWREVLAPYVPAFRFELDDLSTESESALRARDLSATAKLALFCLQRARHARADRDDDRGWWRFLSELRRWADAMRAVLSTDRGRDALAAILSYIMQVGDVPSGELRELLREKVGPDAEEAIMTTADRLRAEGRAEGQRETLMLLLTKRFGELPEGISSRVRDASRDDLETWIERILTAGSLEEIFCPE